MTQKQLPNDYVSLRQFREAEGTASWPVLSDGATSFFPTESLAVSAQLVQAIAALPGVEQHRPRIDIRDDGVTVRLLTIAPDWWGMSRRDIDMARRITAAAASLGLSASLDGLQSVEPIVIGAVDIEKVMPFWQALMGYVRRADSPAEDIVDPRGRGPGIWFERIQGQRSGRNRMHVCVWLPPDQAEGRLAAAIAAGGTVIYDAHAPAWWTLADPEGNEADIGTSLNRD
jgi:4a-hydroxytetrahydrobiopterin dehydratase